MATKVARGTTVLLVFFLFFFIFFIIIFFFLQKQQTFSVQWLLPPEDRFLNEFWFIFHWIRGTPVLWKFDKVLCLPNTFLCAPCSLVTRNGLCCWTTPCLKALLPWNFPRDSFHTELEYLLHLKQQKHCLSSLDPIALTEALSEFARTRRRS